MSQKTYTVQANGKTIQVPVKVNNKLKPKNAKKSGLGKKIATTALVLTIGAGVVIGGFHLAKHLNKTPQDQTPVSGIIQVDQQSLRFDPNSTDKLIENAVFLIEDAAKAGKEISAEDAVLYCVVANSDELKPSFIGKLFGEPKDQKYNYNHLVDAYLRVGMMNVENMALSTTDDLTLNSEEVFANGEDYTYLKNIRTLTTRFNNSTDEAEKKQIADELNAIAAELCTYEVNDISSSAGVLSMLCLDGMRLITNTNSTYTVLPNDIRDEMFGAGDYGCRKDATFVSDGKVLQTQYSYRVNDLKLDSVEAKLERAVLEENETIVLDDIIAQIKDKTKDVVIATEADAIDAINDKQEENRDILYEYEDTKGQNKENYTPKTDKDKTTVVNGKDVVVAPSNDTKPVTNEKTKEEAQKELEAELAKKQAEADKGAADGQYYGENGLAKPSLNGKSESYIKAFNMTYDAYKKIYDVQHSNEPDELIKEEEVKINSSNVTKQEVSSVTESQSKIEETKTTTETSKPAETTDNGSVLVSEEIVDLDDLTPEQLAELRSQLTGGEYETSNGKSK